MEFKIFVITIDRGKDRYKIIERHMISNNIPFTKFIGIDGINLDDKKIKDITTNLCNKICTRSIIGCALSHILLWNHITKIENLDYALIIEDDVIFDYYEFYRLRSKLEWFLKNYSLIILDGIGSGFRNSTRFDNYKLMEYDYCYSHSCYMITKKTAKFLYNHYLTNKISYHIDFTDNKILNYGDKKIGILYPSIVTNIGEDKSTMFEGSKILKFLGPKMYYSLTFPIIKLCNIIINFITIILLLLIIILLLLKIKNIYIWLIVVLFLFESITFI